jgi:hypothetical protein
MWHKSPQFILKFTETHDQTTFNHEGVRNMRRISTKPLIAIAAVAAFALAGATAQAAPLGPSTASGIAAAAETGGATVTPVQYYHHRRHYGYRGYRGGYRGYRHHHNDAGAAIAGGIFGMALGAMIAGSAAQNSNAVQYCASRYRSYDPRSGTYLGYDGYRHPCP